MHPTGPIGPSKSVLILTRADTLVRNWQVGQIVAATVTSRPQSGHVTLRIGIQQVQAQAGNINLQQGQRLELQVVELGRVPSLRVIGTVRPDPVRAALRSALPRQQPLSTLFSQLAQLLAKPASISPVVAEVARNLIARLPDHRQLSSAEGLRQALRDSGLLLESRLASHGRRTPDLTQDLKANLLRLIDALRNLAANIGPEKTRPGPHPNLSRPLPPAAMPASAPTTQAELARLPGTPARNVPESPGRDLLPAPASQAVPRLDLAEQVESALARIRVNQLSSLNQDRAAASEWLVELPARRGDQIDTWQLQVRRDDTSKQGDNRPNDGRWSAILQFDLPNLGAMEARVNLTDETISSVFIAECEGAVAVVEKHLPHLRSRLEALGLEVARLGCRQGEASTQPRAAQSGSLLDEQV